MRNRVLVTLAIASALVGCATATEIELEPGTGGIIAVAPPRDPEARQKAKLIMQENCGGKKPVVTKEGYVKVGQSTSEETNSKPTTTQTTNIFTGRTKAVQGQQSQTSATTRDLNEWRITYKCQ